MHTVKATLTVISKNDGLSDIDCVLGVALNVRNENRGLTQKFLVMKNN